MRRKYKLNVVDGMVTYIYQEHYKHGCFEVVSRTSTEAADWLLDNGKPYKSNEYPGYPIAVNMNNNEYYFAGTWA